MELNKIANETVNEYMARELKEGYEKVSSCIASPGADHLSYQWRWPAAGLLEGLLPALQLQAAEVILAVAAGDCRTLRSLLGLRERGQNAKGYSFSECMSIIQAMPCTYLVMNEFSRS